MASPSSATFLQDCCIHDAGVIQNFTVNMTENFIFIPKKGVSDCIAYGMKFILNAYK